jgi:hypothetical protein
MVASLESRYHYVLRRRLYAILIPVEPWFGEERIAHINRLINTNEFVVALETISDLIVEVGARIDQTTLGEIERLADGLELPERVVDQLRPLLES